MSGFDEPQAHSANRQILQIVPALRQLATEALYVYSECERNPDRFRNVSGWHSYAVPVSLDGVLVFVRLVTRELNKQHFLSLYDSQVTDARILKRALGDGPDPITIRGERRVEPAREVAAANEPGQLSRPVERRPARASKDMLIRIALKIKDARGPVAKGRLVVGRSGRISLVATTAPHNEGRLPMPTPTTPARPSFFRRALRQMFAKNADVKNPGSRGGRYFYNDQGHLQYGDRPATGFEHVPADRPHIIATEHLSGTPYHVVAMPHRIDGKKTGKFQIQARRAGSENPWEMHVRGVHATYDDAAKAYGTDSADFTRHGAQTEMHDPVAHAAYGQRVEHHHQQALHDAAVHQTAAAAEAERQQKQAERKAGIDAGVKAAKWGKGSIKIPQEDGTSKEITGPSIGGLMVQQHGEGRNRGYGVTHVGSGKIVIGRDAKWSQAEAKVAAYRLSKKHDWTMSADELVKHGPKLSGLVSALKIDPYGEFASEAAPTGKPEAQRPAPRKRADADTIAHKVAMGRTAFPARFVRGLMRAHHSAADQPRPH